MNYTRIKICGITRPADAIAAIKAGADAIGLILYEYSARYVSLAEASAIREVIPPLITVVGVFVNPLTEYVNACVKQLRLNLLQFHGDESEEWCNNFNYPYIKSIAMNKQTRVLQFMQDYPTAAGFLLDAAHPHYRGGTGERFDWKQVPIASPKPIILAGGLNHLNVADAIRQTQPFAVDVSSGVELAPGIKDEKKLLAFIQEVRRV